MTMMFKLLLLTTFVNFYHCQEYNIGVGIADITGPPVDTGFFGYGETSQIGSGIHFRLWSRAFVISDSSKSVAIVLCDLGGMSQIVKIKVIESLRQIYGKVYTDENLLLSVTHTHSGPGGYHQYILYNIGSITGFSPQNFAIIVEGIVKSICDAHEMAQKTKGKILFKQDKLSGASLNRSPTSYMLNPADERSKYSANTDNTFQVLKFVDSDYKPIGMYSVFAVHSVSMNKSNKLVSGDNKGYASQLFESKLNPGRLPGRGPYVAAFATGNEGDSSPNILGARCQDTGAKCSSLSSACNGNNQKCIASGPGGNMFESTKLIGEKQFMKAWSMFNSANEEISGPVNYVYQNIDMSNYKVKGYVSKNTTIKPVDRTCSPAMGMSFAAGTTDGVGSSIFTQGINIANPFQKVIQPMLWSSKPTKKMLECQLPKAILLPTGEMKAPGDWQPKIIPTQIIQVGQIYFVALPGEFTTMSGRRLRNAIKEQLPPDSKILLIGLANTYSSYVTTPEEYELQRYEAASTAYGINTLLAYMKQFSMLAKNLREGRKMSPGPPIPNLLSKQISLSLPVILDIPVRGKNFGDVTLDAKSSYSRSSKVKVKFASANPRNSEPGTAYMTVDRFQNGKKWITIADESNWETIFKYDKPGLFAPAEAVITWTIPRDVDPGDYRICHFLTAKRIMGDSKFKGCTRTFKVT